MYCAVLFAPVSGKKQKRKKTTTLKLMDQSQTAAGLEYFRREYIAVQGNHKLRPGMSMSHEHKCVGTHSYTIFILQIACPSFPL